VNNTPTAVTATITVTPNSGVGCVGTPITFTITVNGNSVTPTGATSSVTTNCGPTTTTLTVQGGALGTGASWKWYTGSCGGTLVGTGASITVPVNATTTYYVRAEGTCNTTTCASVTVTINTVPTISIAAAPYTALTPLLKTNLTATVTPVAAGNVVEWYKDNGPIAIATGLSITNINVDQVGSYKARITTLAGCTATSNVVNITDSVSSQLFVYPNPNNGQFKIRYYIPEATLGVVRKVVIFDAKGALVYNQRLPVQTRWGAMDINIRGVAQGDYVIKILDVNEQPVVGARVVILR
jgi:Ig-like domain CHU_C associated/Secretion system C-terminal sorting domain